MKKCAIYCTACVLVGVLFLLLNKQEPVVDEPADPVARVIEDTNEEPVQVLRMDDVLFVLQDLDEASDVHITYTHTLNIDGIDYEMDYVGSNYNYDLDRGHTSVITSDWNADLWYDEEYYVLHTDDVESVDIMCRQVKDYYSSNLATIRLICSMLMQGTTQHIAQRDNYTVYKATSNDQLADGNLLHVTVDSDVFKSSWQITVPNDPFGLYKASLTVYPDENSAGIHYEKFSYEFLINTGFQCKFPEAVTYEE